MMTRSPGLLFLIDTDIAMTNRYVSEKLEGKFIYRKDKHGRRMPAIINFKKEYRSIKNLEFDIIKVLHVERKTGPDLSFLQMFRKNQDGLDVPSQIKLSSVSIASGSHVCAIGHPLRDKYYPYQVDMHKVLAGIYEVKWVSPGMVKNVENNIFAHDCSTVGGSSRSMIYNYQAGEAVGIHFGWEDNIQNYGIPSPLIIKKLHIVKQKMAA